MEQKSVFGIKKPKGVSTEKVKSYRSRSYERHFEGYTYHVELTGNGKKRIVRTYSGSYYESAQSAHVLFLRKIGYLLLYGMSMGMLILYSRCTYQSPWAKLLVFPEMGILFSLLWTGLKLVFYITAPRKMTAGEFKSSCLALISSAKWSVVFWAADSLLFLISALLTKGAPSLWLPPFIMLVMGGITAAAIHLLEKQATYTITATD